jgi:hypothetical protein
LLLHVALLLFVGAPLGNDIAGFASHFREISTGVANNGTEQNNLSNILPEHDTRGVFRAFRRCFGLKRVDGLPQAFSVH